ncbi:MAG: serine/threonine-protein kinase, partial [Verrucomicrobiota bacterium]
MSPETFNAPEPEQLAELLPAYDFEAFIAKGGMGAVYKATQKSLDRAVAIKVLPREFGADPEFRQAFETEAKAMAKLNHPNLISVYDYGDIDGMPYIVMELVEGKSLYHSSWNKAIEPEQAVTIVEGILQGLGHAHEHGILHGDIKPANILLTAKAEPKIGDFGLARPADSEGTGIIMGTPGYAAPELTRSPESIGKSTDLFAVGVILHELLTGIRPDTNDGAPTQPFGDARLDAIWKKTTDADLSRRYATAEEIT